MQNTLETETKHAALAAEFQKRGFANGGPVIDAATVATLQDEVLRVIDERGRSDQPQPVSIASLGSDKEHPVWQIVNIWQASKAFEELIHHPQIASMAAACIGASELRLWHDQIQYKPAAKGGVNPWHQDSPYWGSIEPKDQQITAWIALDDADVDNGCMSMVPGSHRWGDAIKALHAAPDFCALPARYEDHEVAVHRCPVASGSVHFHHSLTWHGSHANTSGRPRRAIAIHYMTEHTVRADGGHLMDRFITTGNGEPIRDPEFPLLWPR